MIVGFPVHSILIRWREGKGGGDFIWDNNFFCHLFTSLNQLWLVAWEKLVMLFNLQFMSCFSTSIFMNHFVHIQQTLCLLVIIFTRSSSNFLSYLLTGFGGLFQPFSRLFHRWDKQVISKLLFLCSSMPNFMWMSIENAIEIWINGQKNQLHFETCPGRTNCPANGTTAQPPGLTFFLVGGAPLCGLFLVGSWPSWVGGAPSIWFISSRLTASLCGEGPSTWFIP